MSVNMYMKVLVLSESMCYFMKNWLPVPVVCIMVEWFPSVWEILSVTNLTDYNR